MQAEVYAKVKEKAESEVKEKVSIRWCEGVHEEKGKEWGVQRLVLGCTRRIRYTADGVEVYTKDQAYNGWC